MLNKKNKKISFLIKFASALHRCGTPSDQLEGFLTLISNHFGLNGEFFSTPTYLMVSFKSEEDEFNHMQRLEPKDYDLNRKQQVDLIGSQILRNEIDEIEGLVKLKAIMRTDNLYPRTLRILAHLLISLSISFILDGSPLNIAFSGFIGGIVGLIEYFCEKFNSKDFFLIMSAFTVGFFSHLVHVYVPLVDPRLIILSGIISLVPGLTLTMAISELANTHLASGTARLMSALVTLLKILFGVVFATKVVEYFAFIDITPRSATYPTYFKILPLILFAVGKSIFLNIKINDFKWVLFSCLCSFYITNFGIAKLGEEAGVFLGALVVSLIAYLWSNFFKRSSQVFLIPGIFLLVPGKMAYESFSLFYEKNIISGINTGFKALIICISIVIGLLVGNTLINTKKRYHPNL